MGSCAWSTSLVTVTRTSVPSLNQLLTRCWNVLSRRSSATTVIANLFGKSGIAVGEAAGEGPV